MQRPDRRAVLAGLGAAAAAPFWPAIAAVPPYRTRAGAIELTVISDGALEVPLSFHLPDTPKDQVAALLTSHGLSPSGMPSQTNVTLLRTGGEVVLIDAGAGSNFQPTAGKLQENMEAAGIDPASVSRIVFTHGHADHLWGAIDDFDEMRFPKARYVISAAEWDFWTDPATVTVVPDWLKGMAAGSARILNRLEGRIERKKAGDAVAPGVSYIDTSGHTPGHVSIMVESGGERLVVAGDVLTHPAISFARPDWRMGSDADRDKGVATRRRLIDQLAADKIPFIGFHLPFPGHGRVEKSGTAWRYVPA